MPVSNLTAPTFEVFKGFYHLKSCHYFNPDTGRVLAHRNAPFERQHLKPIQYPCVRPGWFHKSTVTGNNRLVMEKLTISQVLC